MTTSPGPHQSNPGPRTATASHGLRAPWPDGLGRAGSRCAQLLLIAAVIAGLIWLLSRVSLVVIAGLVALILASAAYPMVRWLVGKGWSRLLATGASFVAVLVLLGGVVTGIVFAVLSQWDVLSVSAVEGWEELQRFLMTGPLPIDTAAIDEAVQWATEFVTRGAFLGGALTGITAATEFISGAVLMIVILFFFLKDGPTMWNFTLRWVHGTTRVKVSESGNRTIQVFGGYVRGTAIIAAVDALLIGAQVEGDLLQPVVMGRTLNLHALVVLLALVAGTIVGGSSEPSWPCR